MEYRQLADTSQELIYIEGDGERSGADLALVFQSRTFIVDQNVLEANSDFVRNWRRFPGSDTSATSSLPYLHIEFGTILVPFTDHLVPITEDDFQNYLHMAYSIWDPGPDPLLAMKIAPIADFMQSGCIRERCDLAAARSSISWSVHLCHRAFDFAHQWSLPRLAAAICEWINGNIPVNGVVTRLLSSTSGHLLAMLPVLDLDPILQAQTLIRYVTRTPLDGDFGGRLHVENDMIDILCSGFRSLSRRWSRVSTIREVLRLTRTMQFENADARLRVVTLLLDLVEEQIVSGPLFINWAVQGGS